MEFGHGQIIDLGAAILMVIAMIGGIRRGLSGELARVIAIAAALYAAWLFSTQATHWVMDQKPDWTQQKAFGVAFAALIIAALAASWLIRAALRSVITFAFKGRLERIGGALCGLFRGAVFSAVILLMLSLVPNESIRSTVTEESWAGRLVCQRLLPVYEDLRERAPELGLPATPDQTATNESVDDSTGGNVSPAP